MSLSLEMKTQNAHLECLHFSYTVYFKKRLYCDCCLTFHLDYPLL